MYIANCFQEVYEYAKNVQSPYLFPSRKGEHPIPLLEAYRQLNKAADFAGVEHVGNHILRKTFGYWFYKATKDIAMLHSSFSSIRYPALYRHYERRNEQRIETFQRFSLFHDMGMYKRY